jgi:hypothetical protein
VVESGEESEWVVIGPKAIATRVFPRIQTGVALHVGTGQTPISRRLGCAQYFVGMAAPFPRNVSRMSAYTTRSQKPSK